MKYPLLAGDQPGAAGDEPADAREQEIAEARRVLFGGQDRAEAAEATEEGNGRG